jgi:hypothetical protein
LLAEMADELALPKSHVATALGHMLWHGQLHTNLQQLLFVDGRPSIKTLVWLPRLKEENGDTVNA